MIIKKEHLVEQATLLDSIINNDLETVKTIVDQVNTRLDDEDPEAANMCEEQYKSIYWLVLMRDYGLTPSILYAIKNLHLDLIAERTYILSDELRRRFEQATPALIEGYIRAQLLNQTDGLDIPKPTFYGLLLEMAIHYAVWNIVPTIRAAAEGL